MTVIALAVWATRTDPSPMRIATPTSTTVRTTTTPAAPPTVAPAGLTGLVLSLEDVKNSTGNQNLIADPPAFQPEEPVSVPDRPECLATFGGGARSAYDMQAVVGYYGSSMKDDRDLRTLTQAGQVLLAFEDAAAAQRQLAALLSIWRQCGGSTLTLSPHPGTKQKPTTVSISVPADAGNGITSIVLTAQGPLLRPRTDHTIAVKNNVLAEVDVLMINTDRGRQAAVDITRDILDKIPG
ncbi:hypothetical protein A4G26_25935 [Mycobacterium kansasii]|uniref:Serine/threonine-protein kinase PknJ n=1 Tax=Mycobacterium innocens TaxID=2341083 RepID=A0A498QB15_9MYCO|nr:sensor domain-containing protein [Mycobacterium innocens]KZS69938.1 hypothetical protein A4G26_25935 [Mycobacterium kansasii]VBA42024.1 Serine/threonine-protein kinase PknJ [Mycobacterium innocens]